MKDKEYPCEGCHIKKRYAKLGYHWHDSEDCPYQCIEKNIDYAKLEEMREEREKAMIQLNEWSNRLNAFFEELAILRDKYGIEVAECYYGHRPRAKDLKSNMESGFFYDNQTQEYDT
jgi:hypothetical protein